MHKIAEHTNASFSADLNLPGPYLSFADLVNFRSGRARREILEDLHCEERLVSSTRPQTAPQGKPVPKLAKVDELAKRYSSASGVKSKKSAVVLSDSDADLSLSLDEEVPNIRKSNESVLNLRFVI